jgi:predicted transposase/invertase (TIGR01784 family)
MEGKIEGMIEGKIKGIIEGKIEGIMEGKIEVARGLKENNVPMEIIIKTTGLTKEQIETL